MNTPMYWLVRMISVDSPGPPYIHYMKMLTKKTRLFHALIFIALQAIIQYPIFHSSLPMLSDYPNHLARMHVLMKAGQSSDLNAFYTINWTAVPNLAMDVVVPTLSLIVGIDLAGKIFIGLTLLLISSGAIYLHYVLHRRNSLWPFIVFLLLYNTMFLYGLLNFLFGIGLALWFFAAWIFPKYARSWWRLAAFPLAAMILFFSHLSAFCFFMLVTAANGCSHLIRGRTVGQNWSSIGAWAAGLAIPICIFLFSPTTGLQQYDWTFSWLEFYSQNILLKPLLILVLFSNYNVYLDTFTMFFVSVFIIKGLRTRILSVSRDMLFPLAAIGLSVLLMPRVLFGSSLADSRLFVALAFIFISSVNIKLHDRKILPMAIACSLTILFIIRFIVILDHWAEADVVTANAIKAMDKMENGKRMLVVFNEHKGETSFLENFEKFLPCLAIISHSAFVPLLYTLPGAQPVVLTPRFEKLKAKIPVRMIPDRGGEWSETLNDYDYVWVAEDSKFAPRHSARMSIIASDSRFQFYRVNKE